MVSPQIDKQVAVRISTSDLLYTRGRQRVVQALARADGPRSAADLHNDLDQDVPLSSLYRSLSILTEVGVVAPHHGMGGVVRYELAEWLMGHHHHLVCDTCGTIDDIELSRDSEAILDALVSEATDSRDFVATGHSLEIEGRCASCS